MQVLPRRDSRSSGESESLQRVCVPAGISGGSEIEEGEESGGAMRTREQIEQLLEAAQFNLEHGPKFDDTSVRAVRAALQWVLGQAEDLPTPIPALRHMWEKMPR